jgi:O-methyltransferase
MLGLGERLSLTSGRTLPRPLQPMSRFVRELAVGPLFTYWADGVATTHFSPFTCDEEFETSYRNISSCWHPGEDVRWRMWLLTSLAQQCQGLRGNFAEFGAWRGGCAYMILERTKVSSDHRFYLFDTFAGIPEDHLTSSEREHGFAGRLADTSVEHVDELLARWRPRYVLCPGDVFETLGGTDVGALSFAHIDLNAAAPTKLALEFAYAAALPGAIIVLDDYGWASYRDQRAVIDEFFADRPEQAIALPTGQAFVVKR